MTLPVVEIVEVIAAIVKQAVELGPTLIKTAQDARPFAEAIVRTLLKRPITVEELDLLEKKIEELSAQLQEQLPDKQADDI